MGARIAEYVTGRFVFHYDRSLQILDIYENGKDTPSYSVTNKTFTDVTDFVNYCNTWID